MSGLEVILKIMFQEGQYNYLDETTEKLFH